MKITDAHMHFYHHQHNQHCFLEKRDPGLEALLGDYFALPKIYLPEQYLKDTVGFEVDAVIWHEMLASDPLQEAEWAQGLDMGKLKKALVTLVEFLDPHLKKRLDFYQTLPAVTVVREHLAFGEHKNLLKDPQWQKQLGLLKNYRFKCALEVFSPQLPDLTHVVKLYPEIEFVVPVMGWPRDLTQEGFKTWKRDIKNLSLCKNICGSISAIECIFGMHWSIEQIKPWILELIEAFGPERTMFGSHLPISKLSQGFAKLYEAYFKITEAFSTEERELMFHQIASDWYRVSTQPKTSA
jgi:predicted TIM-barrel fold metal-dependent hydrolase